MLEDMLCLRPCPSLKIFGSTMLTLFKCCREWWENAKIRRRQLVCKICIESNNSYSTLIISIWQHMIILKSLIFLSHRYIKNHHLHKLNATPNLDYLGHPINAYHLIRHVASGWNRILKDAPLINDWITRNTGQIMWNNLRNDIGKLKPNVWLRTLFCL